MTVVTRSSFATVMLACAFVQPLAVHGAPGQISDKNLEAAVRAVLHEPSAELTDEKLGNVYVLEADRKDIRDLAGLEKCKNLSLLKLSHNQISDLKPIKDLANLQSLDLSANRISDI